MYCVNFHKNFRSCQQFYLQIVERKSSESNRDPKPLFTIAEVVDITRNLYMNPGENKSEALRMKWNKVTGRIDLILLVTFSVANAAVCVCFLAIGASKLDD